MYRYFEINENGHNIRCKLYCQEPKNIRRVVVFGSGFGGHKDNSTAEKFAQRLISKYKHIALITFNWPCHGDDVKKRIQLDTCSQYLQAVIGYVGMKYTTEEIYCYATSFGGYLVLKYISEHGNPFKKIVLRCPAVNMYDALTRNVMSEEELAAVQKGKKVSVGFDRKIMVDQLFMEELQTCDIQKWDFLDYAEEILILHGTADEIIPMEVVYDFAENNLISFVPIERADHRFQGAEKMELANKQILEFYEL